MTNLVLLTSVAATLFTYFFTFLGSLSIFLVKKISNNFLNLIISFSTGIMLSSIFFSLLLPALNICKSSIIYLTITLFLGSLVIYLISKISNCVCKTNQSSNIILSVILHNIPEGLVVGLAFSSTRYFGLSFMNAFSIILGIALQNFPEGIAVAFPLYKNGYSKKKAFFYSQLCGIAEIISGLLGVLFIDKLLFVIPYLMCFAVGAMLYAILSELIPDYIGENKKEEYILLTIIGFCFMMFLELIFS